MESNNKKRHKISSVFINAVFVLLRHVRNVSYTITYRTSLRIDIFVMRGTLIMLFILNIQKYVSRPLQGITNYVTFAVTYRAGVSSDGRVQNYQPNKGRVEVC